MPTDEQDPTIPAFLRLSPNEQPQRMRCLTPMLSLSALAAARVRYETQFGTLPEQKDLERHGVWRRVELLTLACERGVVVEALPEAQPKDGV